MKKLNFIDWLMLSTLIVFGACLFFKDMNSEPEPECEIIAESDTSVISWCE